LHARPPKLSNTAPPTCPRPQLKLSGTHTTSVSCHLSCVSTTRICIAACSTHSTKSGMACTVQWTCSTHLTPRSRPSGMCVWGLFWLDLMSFPGFHTQLAPQQIKPPSFKSAEIQNPNCALCLYCKALSLLLCKSMDVHTVEVHIGGLIHHWQANAFACQWCVRPPICTSTHT
jgi:hypothetical protein